MDNLTHTLVGLTLGRLGLGKTTPRGTGMLILAANLPDIDAVYYFGGAVPYIEHHRTYTHSLVFLPLVALLPVLLVRAKFRWQTYLASMLAVLSHLLLDWTNSYGVPLLLPFSERRFRLDIVNIVDIWIWVILLGSLFAAELASGWGNLAAKRGWAWAALLVLLAYEGARWAAHDQAVRVMSSRLYQGVPPRRVTALAEAYNPLAWRGVIEGDGYTILAPVNLAEPYEPGEGRMYRSAPANPATEAALRTHAFQVMQRFAQVPFWTVTPVAQGVRVELTDLRFGTPDRPGFAAVAAVVTPAGAVMR